MTEQLHLFADDETGKARGDSREAGWEGPAGGVDELWRASARWSRGGDLLELFDFLCRFPGYTPLNAFLILLQNPQATQVATARAWITRHGRRIRPGARPIAILAPMSPVVFVFDVADTLGPPPSPAGPSPGSGAKKSAARFFDALAGRLAAARVAVTLAEPPPSPAERSLRLTPALRRSLGAAAPPARMRALVRLPQSLPPEERLAALAVELAHLFCGHLGGDEEAGFPDRGELPAGQIDLEAESAASLACRRLGFAEAQAQLLSSLRERPGEELPPFSLNAVFQAATRIEALGRAALRHGRGRGSP
ncbi:MAG: hypothetical protein WHT06_06260 [Desulfobacterales bacterium]